jgi:glycerol-3-phosphate dehydrogenase (NAD(P)+)
VRCAVVGGGAWGTALADVLARNGEHVTLWAREPEVVESINARHLNDLFLAGMPLHAGLRAEHDLPVALRGAELAVLAAPSQVLRAVVRGCASAFARSMVLVVASKGIERETLAVMTAVAEQELPGRDVVALSGPSFAAEVAARQPTAIVAASINPDAAGVVQRIFSSDTFRVYSHDDVLGVELGGALKNVMAVATGIAEGLGLGFNPRAALITRGLAEMSRLGTALGARAETFAGLAGLGDLVLTCTGALSRNRALGMEVGRGASLDQALAGKQTVAEGVDTTRSAHALAQRQGVEMPIVDAVFRILFEGSPARAAIGELMTRELRAERDQ